MSEPQVQLRHPCENCGGTGRVKAESFAGGTPAPGYETQICRACNETGYRQEWLPVSELKRYLA